MAKSTTVKLFFCLLNYSFLKTLEHDASRSLEPINQSNHYVSNNGRHLCPHHLATDKLALN